MFSLLLKDLISDFYFTLINIYGPNRDDSDFYEEITNNVKYSENPIIIAGDFNMVLDPGIGL